MKMYDKNGCEYKGGYIVRYGEVVCIDNEVVDILNKLEEDIQRARYNKEVALNTPCSLPVEPFARETERGEIYPYVVANTPTLDNKVEQTQKIMDELDAMQSADEINNYFAGIGPVIQFVNDNFIVSCEQGAQHRFDLPTIGNPLKLDEDKLSELVMGMFD